MMPWSAHILAARPCAAGAQTLAYRFDETPMPQRPVSVFGALGIVFLLVAIIIVYVAFLRRPRAAAPSAYARHGIDSDTRSWHERVAQILARFNAGQIDDDEAYRLLAHLCRDYATMRTGSDMSTTTLTDIRRASGAQAGMRPNTGLQALRQTIAALYPPEFADPATNPRAAEATVETACDWVDRLIEGWH